MPVAVPLSAVRRMFPEARRAPNGEINLHCRKGHRKGSKNWKLYVNQETGAYYCQDCGDSGNFVTEFLSETSRARFFGMDFPEADAEEPIIEEAIFMDWEGLEAPGQMERLDKLPSDHPAVEYIESRGIDLSFLHERDMPVYCAGGGKYKACAGRIVFPIRHSGQLMGWTARVIEKRGRIWRGARWVETAKYIPKYFALPSMKKSRVLHLIDYATDDNFVAICEGTFDSFSGGPGFAAYLQDHPSEYQIEIILDRWEGKTVFWIMDSGVPVLDTTNPSHGRVFEAYGRMKDRCDLIAFKLEGYDDPGCCPRNQIWTQMERAYDRKTNIFEPQRRR